MTPKHTPKGKALTALVLHVFRLNGLILEAGDALAAPSGQTASRWQVMGCVDVDAQTVAGIARTMGLARQSVQRTADLLVADGLAEYLDNPQHRRAKLLRLTATGIQLLREIEARQTAWANQLAQSLNAAELASAARTLQDLQKALAPDT